VGDCDRIGRNMGGSGLHKALCQNLYIKTWKVIKISVYVIISKVWWQASSAIINARTLHICI
jgi:hypothetical protein